MSASSADARGRAIIAKAPSPLRAAIPPGSPTKSSTRPSRSRYAPTAARSSGAAPSARAARRTPASGAFGPIYQARPPLNRTSAAPGTRANATTETGAAGKRIPFAPQITKAPMTSAPDQIRFGQTRIAPRRNP